MAVVVGVAAAFNVRSSAKAGVAKMPGISTSSHNNGSKAMMNRSGARGHPILIPLAIHNHPPRRFPVLMRMYMPCNSIRIHATPQAGTPMASKRKKRNG